MAGHFRLPACRNFFVFGVSPLLWLQYSIPMFATSLQKTAVFKKFFSSMKKYVCVYPHAHKSSPGKCGAALMFFIVNRCFYASQALQRLLCHREPWLLQTFCFTPFDWVIPLLWLQYITVYFTISLQKHRFSRNLKFFLFSS